MPYRPICKKIIQQKSGTTSAIFTSAIITHLKKLHGQLSKYNASKISDQLSALKEESVTKNKIEFKIWENAKLFFLLTKNQSCGSRTLSQGTP